MGCCGDREKGITVTEEQKWDFITLSDFKSRSCLTPLSYVWLWILVLVSGAVYAADAFTAVNLLAFNKWSSQVQPKVPFDVAKWIFAVTIILSYVFLVYRWIRALRVIRSGGIAECYLEPLAAIWQSMRVTKQGQGWRRFLVFAELTKSSKGVDYIALFVYFQFKGALIIVLAQGPRIAINAMTLWAVMQAQLLPTGEHAATKDTSSFVQFFKNIETLVNTGNRQETIVYFTMLFSFVIWAIAALSLLLSLILYVCFLWHHVPKSDGSLTAYCRRKIETRLQRVVGKKIKKALEKQDQKRRKEEQAGMTKGDGDRCPTLPKLDGKDDDASSFSMTRSDTFSTMTTLPPYSANAPSRTNTMSTTRTAGTKPSLASMNSRPYPGRSDTNTSFGSNAPLLSQAGDMGMASPLPPMPELDRNVDYFNGPQGNRPAPNGLPGRPYSPMSQGRASPRPPRSMLPPVDTNYNGRVSPSPQLVSPLPNDLHGPSPAQGNAPYPTGRPGVSPLGPNFAPYDNRGPRAGPAYEMSPVDMTPVDNMSQQYYPNANASRNYMPRQMPSALRPGSPAQMQQSSGLPARAGTAPPSNPRAGLPATLQSAIQRREASQPNFGQGMNGAAPQQRSATAPLGQPGWNPRAGGNTFSPGPQGY
ncbi:hypothetical protein K458DRAFT_310754 [Lentithecium fluviatile CBS 122367]|uniref:Pheromone-regulated membrane protein n=1 Tax=Lentithecium fluviatile CBS 122367 TaxID=1168545 RepID=A0A6G1IRS6_9PLEO|nr:hypothetical protein K458DRAFT_310754 [Lentithecium fluviatile CBS 122367]